MSRFKVKPYQQEAVDKMRNGCILKAGTGTGKSFMGLLYYWTKVCDGVYTDDEYLPMKSPRPLLIITTPKKRDCHEWDKDLAPFLMSSNNDTNKYADVAPVTVDSWNNIKKYGNVYGYFVIFDENCLSSWGSWTKTFLKIAKKNQWILLTATPGDDWQNYIPTFIANGFYKNKRDFYDQHVEMNPFTRYPSIKKYHNTGKLLKLRKQIIVSVSTPTVAVQHHTDILCNYDIDAERTCLRHRWHPFEDRPLRDATEMAVVMRRIAFSSVDREEKFIKLTKEHKRMIVFYDYDFELDILRQVCDEYGLNKAEWNGHKHEQIPDTEEWIYLVQYTAGNAAWNCTICDCMVFYNNNYSYKKMIQAAGRIDRLDTPFKDLYYYHLTSKSYIDKRIAIALKQKKEFNDMREFRRYF